MPPPGGSPDDDSVGEYAPSRARHIPAKYVDSKTGYYPSIRIGTIVHTLKSQIILALGVMGLLFAAAILYALDTIERQRQDDHVLRIGSELSLLQQQLGMQAMHYKENAPRDYTSYFRDTRLYFRELQEKRSRLGLLITALADDRLPESIRSHHDSDGRLGLSAENLRLARRLKQTWDGFNTTLEKKLGDPKEPRMEWGAEWILEQHPALDKATRNFLESLRHEMLRRSEHAKQIGRILLTVGLVLMLGILGWFYRRVLHPLQQTVNGFRQVASGDFSYRVKGLGDNEIGWLVDTFNHLTGRLDALLQLLTELQQTKTLDESLSALAHTLPRLVPLDWVGVLLLAPDGRMKLERAYSDGHPDDLPEQAFRLQETLLEECLHNGTPLHIPNVQDTARLEHRYRFLSVLGHRGRNDAIFMPVLGNDPKVGVLVLASRHPNTYQPEQIQLLHNLSPLFSATLGRTVALVEGSRLASIGQFASGIVHEIRTPLATIGMALEHLATLDSLPEGSRRRVHLACDESQRLGRLLEDILLYAKPLQLQPTTVRLAEVIGELEGHAGIQHPLLRIETHDLTSLPEMQLDRDRIKQVLLNLLRNAIEANGEDPRGIQLTAAQRGDCVEIMIENGGPPIEQEQLERLFEPFYTSKASGTGLGLPIVRRIVEAHGGSIEILSGGGLTRARVSLPIVLPDQTASEETD